MEPDAAADTDGDDEVAGVLWATSFAPGMDLEDGLGVAVASRTHIDVAERAPDGRTGVLRIRFGEADDGSDEVRWGVDLRHDLDAMGVGPQDEVWFGYDVYFPADFEFIGEGKLGGLGGVTDGLGPLDTSSGGNYDERSFSARAMWQQDRGVVMYLYVRHAAGRDITDGRNFGFGIAEPFVGPDGSTAGVFQPDTWHRVEHRVRMNTPGQNDGVYELWVDGHQGIAFDDVQYRTEAHPDLTVNQVLTTWFFGGSSSEFPTRLNEAYTDVWALSDRRLGDDVRALFQAP